MSKTTFVRDDAIREVNVVRYARAEDPGTVVRMGLQAGLPAATDGRRCRGAAVTRCRIGRDTRTDARSRRASRRNAS